MRGLDRPDNPYHNRYREWDRWALENGKDLRMVDWGAWRAGKIPNSYRMIYVSVDTDGYPVPILEDYQRKVSEAHAPQTRDKNACSLAYMAFGEPPAQMLAQLQAAEMELKASYAPRIPHWLVNDPPQWAVLLPDGDAITSGELGSGREMDPFYTWCGEYFDPQQPFYYYNRAGRLVGKLEVGDSDWYKLCWPQAASTLAKFDQANSIVDFRKGCVVVRRYGGKDVLAVYDYNGTVLPAGTDPALRDGNVWNGWVGLEIPALYAAQQRLQANTAATNK